MYRTTKEFLRYFGLNAITDLPRLQEFAEVLGLRPEELEATLAASESLAAFGEEAEADADHAVSDVAIIGMPDEA
jgi:hypothetical protein